ncbi:MAG: amidohydrolase family protein [Gammaproteobacteria bacterium]|nr:amidohydrolase family protein [Gammaproteobacteria bacterium]
MSGIVDNVCNLYTPQTVAEGRTGLDDAFRDQIRMPEDMRGGVEIADYLDRMDRAGIERSLLVAVRAGQMGLKDSFEVPYEYVSDVCAEYPARFSGLAGIDPTRGMAGLKDLEYAVNELGFVGAHWYPHWFAMPPDSARMYPYYAKCCELDIPIMMQVGQNLVYSRSKRLPSVGRPIALDPVAVDFPDLKLIGIHIGVPWTEEMIAMCWKHENVYTAGDAYAPRYWPAPFVHYLNSYGRDKVMFGTDWPVIDPERAVAEVNELELRPESRQCLLRDNALKVFRLPSQ